MQRLITCEHLSREGSPHNVLHSSSLILIPFHRFLLYHAFHKCIPSMLKCITAGLLMTLVEIILIELYCVFVYDDIQIYLFCAPLNVTVWPDDHVVWYWKLGPFLLHGTGKALAYVYASVGGAPEAYGSRRVCLYVFACISLQRLKAKH